MMTKLIFMPWYSISEKIKVGDYELYPFSLKKPNPDITHIEADAKIILSNYLEMAFTITEAAKGGKELPITKATIIVDSKDRIDKEIEVLQYIISFCAISSRKFLNDGYLCSENLKIYVQKYVAPLKDAFAPFIEKRRKDGGAGMGWTSGYFREVRPIHVPSQSSYGIGLEFDPRLADSLWGLYSTEQTPKQDEWKLNIFPSLFSYYEANTDGKLQQSDCIYSHTAIERLLLGEDYKEENLVKAAVELLKVSEVQFDKVKTTTRNWTSIFKSRNPKSDPVESMFEGWLREHTRLRNSFAHGNHSTDLKLIWNIEEHLIISTYLYPLLLKLKVSKLDEHFALKRLDIQRLVFFEHILAIDEGCFMKEHKPNSGVTYWGKVYEAAAWEGIIEETALEHGFEYGGKKNNE